MNWSVRYVLVVLLALCACRTQIPYADANHATNTTEEIKRVEAAHSAQIFVLPEDGEQVIYSRVSAAKRRVFMTMYLITDLRIVDALAVAKHNGAEVRALVEAGALGGVDNNKLAISKLDEAGISVRQTNPAFRLTHQKTFVVDDTALILTPNMTRSAFKGNREFGLLYDQPDDVAEMVVQFNADWNRTSFNPHSERLVWSPNNARSRWTSVIHGAHTTLSLYSETTTDQAIELELSNAVKRGVRVRLLISPPSRPDQDANKQGLDELQRGGVLVRYLKTHYVHAKMILADSELMFIGSQNISTASLDFNRELGLILDDRVGIQRVMDTFEEDWNHGIDR